MSSSNLIEFHKFFFTPVWRYHYQDWERDEELFIKFLSKDSLYINEREKNNLVITRANLHKEPALKRLTDWMQSCSESTMSDMGYLPQCGITSMWATRQKENGFHHRHYHCNSFLGGSFHVFDSDQKASGTAFSNMDIQKYQIQPAIDPNKKQMFNPTEYLPFFPGTLIMFPAWAMHFTVPTPCQKRIIVGLNVMPIGMTNHDHFDRYNYPDPATMQLKEYQG